MVLSRVLALQTFFFELREGFYYIEIHFEVQGKEVTLDLGHSHVIIIVFTQNEDSSIAEVLPLLFILSLSLLPDNRCRLALLFGDEGIEK